MTFDDISKKILFDCKIARRKSWDEGEQIRGMGVISNHQITDEDFNADDWEIIENPNLINYDNFHTGTPAWAKNK